jgi:hypothetical protein
MARTRIDRFTMDAGTMSPGDARQLSLLIAERLATADIVPGGDVPRLRVSIERSGTLHQLAERIVADALRQIRRTP